MDLSKLTGVIPDVVLNQIADTSKNFEINTPLRLAHFLAQCAHESGGFSVTQENLNYSAKGLLGVFGKYFPTVDKANEYAKHPQKIANLVYANRMGNGDEESGDGWKFHGRGYIQLTGHDNYVSFGTAIGQELTQTPDSVADDYPLESAAWFFKKNGILPICDRGNGDEVVASVTKRVNGGLNGLDERTAYFEKYYKLLA